MRTGSIRPYQIGLAALGALTIAVLVLVVFQAVNGRQDIVTNKKAIEIADALNNYGLEKNKVPANLSAAGIKNVPKTITYHKLSDTSYTFCATYKAKSSMSLSGISSTIQKYEQSTDPYGIDEAKLQPSSNQNSDYLDVSTYHKGQNCQTVTLYDYQESGGTDSSKPESEACPYPYDDSSDQAYQKYMTCIDDYYNSQPSESTQQPTTTTRI